VPENPALLSVLIAYPILMLGIGVWASRRSRGREDYYLGGRRLGPWIGALSAAASSSSAWTLLGVSGAAFSQGLAALWLLPGCLGGFALNWFVVAERLREASAADGSLTLVDFLARDLPAGAARKFRISATLVILLSLLVYVASQFRAAGVSFEQSLAIGRIPATLIGAGVVLLYTIGGGFWAVSVTDLVQGWVMVAAAVALPVVALLAVGGPGGMWEGLRDADPGLLDPLRGRTGMAAFGVLLGAFGIGLGYPGQPHVVVRFMALRGRRELRRAAWISMVWALLIYGGMLVAGWCGRSLFPEGDPEAVLLRLSTGLFPPAAAGLLVAAVLSAVMSTADSQLLVCASTVDYDLGARRRRGIWSGRSTVAVLGVGATLAALWVDESIFRSVLFAWSGLGAAFGPLLLVRLLRGPVRPGAALGALWGGFLSTVVWYSTPALKGMLYELVPVYYLLDSYLTMISTEKA